MPLKPVSMARSNQEKIDAMRPMTDGTPASDIPDYPYGLTIHLDMATLQKLGLSGGRLDPGDKLNIVGTAIVTGAQADMRGGMAQHSADLQIDTLAAQVAQEEPSLAERIYGGTNESPV